MPTPSLNARMLVSPEEGARYDQAHMAAAAYLARYGGQTLRTYSHDLRYYFNWCAEVGLYRAAMEERGLAASAIRKKAPTAVLWIATAATYLLISAFFDTITANHRPLAVSLMYDFWVKLPMIAFSIWFVLVVSKNRGSFDPAHAWFRRVCLVAVVVLIPLFMTVASVSPRTEQLHNLRLFWSGLDVFELIGMALTGLCLLRRSPNLVGAATITGTLLMSDAWFNIITTIGKSQIAALVMAFVEVPVAVYSFVIARREISSWSVGRVGSVNAISSGRG
jgi:hypothetical protein